MTVLRRLWALRRRRPGLALAAGLTGAFLLAYPFVDLWLRDVGVAPQFVFWDFGAYGGAVGRWEAGEPIYVRSDGGGFHGKYLYPPFTVLLFWPFTRLGYPLGAATWGAVSVLVLWAGMVGLLRRLGHDLGWPDRLLVGWAILGFQPLLLALKMGQTAGFLTGLLCLAYAVRSGSDGTRRGADDAREQSDDPRERATDDAREDSADSVQAPAGTRTASTDTRTASTGARPASTGARPRSFLSGGLTAVVGLSKLPYAPAAAHLLADRDRLLGGVAAGVGLLALSLAVFGVDAHVAYLDVLRWGIDAGSRARHPSLWLAPYYRPYYAVAEVSFLIQVALSLVIAALALRATDAVDAEVFALGMAAVPLISPKTYAYYLVVLLPAATVLFVREYHREGYPAVALLGLVLATLHSYGLKLLVDLGPRFGGMQDVWNVMLPFLQPGLWANVLLVGFAAWRVSQHVVWPAALTKGRNQAASKGD